MRSPTFASRGPSPLFFGVIHFGPTPGSPGYRGSLEASLARAAEDAEHLVQGGVDGLVVENFGDAPFFADRVPPETVAALTRAACVVREVAPRLPLGINVLRNDAYAALGIAAATGADFIRVNVHTGSMLTDQGLIQGEAAETLRRRAALAPQVQILADVHVKHASPLGDESLEQAAEDCFERGLADGLILSGAGTGRAPGAEAFAAVHGRVPEADLWVGSGLDEGNAREILVHARGAIVGTTLKHEGAVHAPVELARVQSMRKLFDQIRRG